MHCVNDTRLEPIMANVIRKDLVIVGGGPAGLSAGIYATRALLDTVILEKEAVGGQTILTTEIDNYPGMPHTDGFTIADTMQKQAEDLGAEVVMGNVVALKHDDATGLFEVITPEVTYEARSVIVSGGATPRHAGFEGEERFTGHGVSYCATCDGMFYRGKHVFVIGGGNTAVEESLFLARFADKVTLIVRKDHLRAAKYAIEQFEAHPKTEIRYLTSITKVDGNDLLNSVTFRNNETGEEHTETYEEGSFGIFVLVGRVPSTELLDGLADVTPQGYVVANPTMATKTPGLFTAGDLNEKPLRQIITAASDGAVAAASAALYLGQAIDG